MAADPSIDATPDEIGAHDLIRRAVDPDDPALRVIGWPGRRLVGSLATGDVLVRDRPGGRSHRIGIVADPALHDRSAAMRLRLELGASTPGRYARIIAPGRADDGAVFAERVTGADGLVAPGVYVVRALADAAETPPIPPAARPMLRRGSTGPHAADAQTKLNRAHAKELASGRPGLDRCPLEVDGKFGPYTQAATIAFQRRVFPATPAEWDGVIGPRTWAALDAYGLDAPGPPVTPPDIPVPPIIPVIHKPLRPERWDPILRGAMSPHAKLRSGNAVRTLIDGLETFEEMANDIRATNGEKDYVYLLGWDIVDDYRLIPKAHDNPARSPATVRNLFTEASARGVQIRVMLWAKPPLKNTLPIRFVNGLKNGAGIRDDETANNTPMNRDRLKKALAAAGVAPALIPIIVALIRDEDLVRFTGAHHQKVLVIKRGETLVAYCGGIDVNANRLDVVDAKNGDPQHDAHCRIVGPSAWDLLDTFVRRWRHHPDGARIDADPVKGPLRGVGEPVPAPLPQPAPGDAPFGGTVAVAIARTFNPTRKVAAAPRERDIGPMLLAAIGRAERFIYLEDQYLIDLKVADALNAAIPRLAHVTILIMGNPINSMPFGNEYRRDFGERLFRGLSAKDAVKIGLFQLSTDQAAPVYGRHTYVHAKTWVFDDELAVIGSANCNRRGYVHDSEVDAFIFDDPPTSPPLVALRESAEAGLGGLTFAQHYRMRLWREHLRAAPRDLLDGVASVALWRATPRPKGARVLPFDHRLAPGKWQSTRDSAADAMRFLIDPVVP